MKKMSDAGFSLLEFLIASALGTLIIAGLMRTYLSIKTNYNRQQSFMDLQDSGRFSEVILNQRIRLAGFVGCVNAEFPVDQNQAIVGYDSEHLPSQLQNQVIKGTDAIVIHSCTSNSKISEGAALVSMAYYIGDTDRTNLQGQPIFSLFQKPLDGDREELIAGVEQMKIVYGVMDSRAPGTIVYYPAASVVNWEAVRSVQIDYLLNSVDAILTKPQAYYFQGQMILPDDLLLHKTWSVYVTLRERVGDELS